MKWNAVEVEIILKTQYFTVWYIGLAYNNTRKSDYVTAFCQNPDGIVLIFYFFLEVSKIQESTIISSLANTIYAHLYIWIMVCFYYMIYTRCVETVACAVVSWFWNKDEFEMEQDRKTQRPNKKEGQQL